MKTRIVCYGDSNTYGYNPENDGRYDVSKIWPSILKEKLGNNYEVINEGKNGRTTAYGIDGSYLVNGLDDIEEAIVNSEPIDILVFMLGTNDCSNILNLCVNDIATGLDALINKAEKILLKNQEALPQIVVVVPGAINDNFAHTLFVNDISEEAVKKSKEIATLYQEVAIKHNAKYIDARNVDVSKLDAMHLTLEGHKQIAELVFRAIN